MKLEKLYDIAERENINIINFKMKNKAIIGCLDNNYTIGMNYSIIENSIEEKTILAEELRTLLHGCHISTFLYG